MIVMLLVTVAVISGTETRLQQIRYITDSRVYILGLCFRPNLQMEKNWLVVKAKVGTLVQV